MRAVTGAAAPPAPRRTTSRPTELTRQALLEAATAVFAEHGYAGGSVRLITTRARANQAAITYHFGGKDGLYREVLRAAVAALEESSPLDEETVERLSREEALRLLLRQFLAPLAKPSRLGRYIRIFGWESVSPSPVYRAFLAEEPMPVFALATRLVRRFLPEAPEEEVAFAMFWLVQQPIALVRDAERLAGPPFRLHLDGEAVERLVDRLAGLILNGLRGGPPAEDLPAR